MGKPAVPVGFDYARALLDIRGVMTYEQIAAFTGYESVASVARVLAGAIPPHPQGEAIWSLYLRIFETKPPITAAQAAGVQDFPLEECALASTGT